MAAIFVILGRIYGPDDTVNKKKKKRKYGQPKLKECRISVFNECQYKSLADPAIRADRIAGRIIKYSESTAIRKSIFSKCAVLKRKLKATKIQHKMKGKEKIDFQELLFISV